MSINLVFKEEEKQNIIIKGNSDMPFSELIQKYFKNICASKRDKLTKIFYVKGKETSREDSQKLSELGLKDFSEIEIISTVKAVTFTAPKKEESKPLSPAKESLGEELPKVQQMEKLEDAYEKEAEKESQPKDNKIINISFEKQNEEYKIKINKLEKYIKELELKIKEKEKIINEEKIKNNNLNEEIKKIQDILKINSKVNDIIELENEIKLFRSYYNFSEGEKLISIKFITDNQDINFEIITKNTEEFLHLESILYKQYPKYIDSENFFLVNGNKINKHRSLKENKINNNDIITLKVKHFD